MSDTITTSRVEPILDPGPASAAPPPPVPYATEERRDVSPMPRAVPVETPVAQHERPSSLSDQLARLEDKTSRIEEKLARAEASTQRVVDRFEASSHRMSEVAQQSDLMAMRGDVKFVARRAKNLPGFSALILSSVITAVLTAVLTVVIIRYMPALLGR